MTKKSADEPFEKEDPGIDLSLEISACVDRYWDKLSAVDKAVVRSYLKQLIASLSR